MSKVGIGSFCVVLRWDMSKEGERRAWREISLGFNKHLIFKFQNKMFRLQVCEKSRYS